MSVASYAACSPAERAEAIQQLGALITATTAELVDVITAADRAEDWKVDGATAMAPWLVAALGVSSATARAWVDTGARLDQLPCLRGALGEGALSWDQARPAATFVTPDDDEVMARHLPGCSAAQIERLARAHRPRRTAEEQEAARVRGVRWRADHHAGGYRYSGFLPTELGEVVNHALTRHAEAAGPDPDTGLWAPFEVRAADALVDLARARIGVDPDPDTCLVVVHVDADVVDGTTDGNGTIGDHPISVESVRRLLCDTKIDYAIDGPDGTTIGIGRADRTIPRWLRRRITHRDSTCRFPGCSRAIRHRHHIQHWSQGGPTDANNLVGLCWHHHHLVHEGGWTVVGNADRDLTFTSPTGRQLHSRPRPVDPAAHRRARRAANLPELPAATGPPGRRRDPATTSKGPP